MGYVSRQGHQIFADELAPAAEVDDPRNDADAHLCRAVRWRAQQRDGAR